MNWQLEQKKLAQRTRRTPSQSVLYQICFNLSQELENNFEEKYQAQYVYYRKSITEALDKYLNCGILKHGCARAVCENCEHEELICGELVEP